MHPDTDYGYFRFQIEEYLKQHGISKYWLIRKAQLQDTQLNNYCKNKVQRADLAVLARICHALQCELSDILVYHAPDQKQ